MAETAQMTQDELLLYLPENWLPLHAKIRNKNFDVVPFGLNAVQKVVLRTIVRLESEGKPIRIIILKARKLGITTFFCGMCYYWCCCLKNREALISAHDDESSTMIFSIVKMMNDENYESPPTDHTTRKEVIYSAPHRSRMSVQTAGRETLARGSTPSYAHLSEVAFWKDAKKSLTSVLNAVPNRPGTMVTLESTANGMGGEFYNRWLQAIKGESDFVPLFFPWFDDPENKTSVPAEGLGHLDGDEIELREKLGVGDEQLYWRRRNIENECGGDGDLFRQENPSHWKEAFLVSGRPVFRIGDMERIESNCHEPIMSGALQAGVFVGEKFPVRIWQTPLAGHIYGIGVDTAEGKQADTDTMPDASAAKVIDANSGFLVASFDSREEVDEVANQVNELGLWYDEALMGIEINGTSGGAMRECLKRLEYPNLYRREKWDQALMRVTESIGWRTDNTTRKIMLTDLFAAVRDCKVYITDELLLEEMRSFVYNSLGKAEAMVGCFDDQVIALAICWQMCLKLADDGIVRLPQVAGEQMVAEPDYSRPDYLLYGYEQR